MSPLIHVKPSFNPHHNQVSEGSPVTNIAFSENGYHVATLTHSTLLIWDLRKQKVIGTIQEKTYALSFDPTACYLAYATEGSTKICVAKDWERVVCSLDYEKKKTKGKKKVDTERGGVAWGNGGGEEKKVWVAMGCDGEKPVRFYGVE